ncbi:hypothetical protein D7U93_18190 [Stenotrophomonas maltophilia]|nr:hypothetical protein [Stenotrophomonas maltophilia]MBA0409975.1 hypothetical protein [Stenotrophomonas maltophilia]MBA0480700.1 hypothetical protein [Stenotrophomonas maltophilia]MBA0489437.1 hypothetical protein [Stenotrophomonas maltophilia]
MPAAVRQPGDASIVHEVAGQRPALPQKMGCRPAAGTTASPARVALRAWPLGQFALQRAPVHAEQARGR